MTDDRKCVWVLRFAAHLHKIEPAVSGTVAAQIANDTFAEASDLSPEEAAEIYALEQPPADVGAPGDT